MDHTRIWRIERRLADPTHEELGAIGAVVGLDVRLRPYPAGDALRDAGQLRLLARLRARLHPNLVWNTEVPLPINGDLRAWDAEIRGADWIVRLEAETVIDDVQALERRFGLKRRDGDASIVILLIADTRRNRDALAVALTADAFADLPGRTRGILEALGRGRQPASSGIVLL